MAFLHEKGNWDVITTKPAKSLQGKLDLPPSPDLFLLSAITAIAAQRSVSLSPVIDTPLIRMWTEVLKGQAILTLKDTTCHITPLKPQEASGTIQVPCELLPYRDQIIFILLGMGKAVQFESLPQKRIETWGRLARTFGFNLEIKQDKETTSIQLTSGSVRTGELLFIDEETIAPFTGLLLGLRQSSTFPVEFQFANPLRMLAPLFGFDLSVKSSVPKETDPIARRLKFMQAKKKQGAGGQQFTVIADFSKVSQTDEPVGVTLPGDEVLSGIMVAAKCLLTKGSFVISNMPLETWATPVLALIRKMGSKISIQETHRTSFGSAGMFSIQKCELIGRKTECKPVANFIPYLSSMVVVSAFASGQSIFRNLEDLRSDIPDGIEVLESCIRALGARHGEMPDGIVMEGGRDFDGFDLNDSLPAHIAGSFAIAGLKCMGTTTINDDLLKQRWPDFEKIISTQCEFRS